VHVAGANRPDQALTIAFAKREYHEERPSGSGLAYSDKSVLQGRMCKVWRITRLPLEKAFDLIQPNPMLLTLRPVALVSGEYRFRHTAASQKSRSV
jgi:hypothetical protein